MVSAHAAAAELLELWSFELFTRLLFAVEFREDTKRVMAGTQRE